MLGTNILSPLQIAFEESSTSESLKTCVFLLTDGAVSDKKKIIQYVD